MSDIKELTQLIEEFREERDWKQFHKPKDMAISLALEAAEVLEHFQWRESEALETYVNTHREEIGEELSDVLYWVFLMSRDFTIDIKEAFIKKMAKNRAKYPVAVFRGKHSKEQVN